MYGEQFELPAAVQSKDFVVEIGKAKIERRGTLSTLCLCCLLVFVVLVC